jgi:hypothetical protein
MINNLDNILYDNINIDRLSKNEYLSIINMLKIEYKILLTSINKDTSVNQIYALEQTKINLERKISDSLEINKHLVSKLTNKLTLKERILGKIDLKSRTQG